MIRRPPPLLTAALLGAVLLTQSYIDLELAVRLPGWTLNAPIADLAALCLIPLAAWGWLGGTRHPLPGPGGYLLLLLAGALSLLNALDPSQGAHFLIRKPLFLYVAYAFGVAWAVRSLPARWTLGLVLAWAASTAGVSVVTSAGRIVGGEALWFQAIEGLTPNHKTLAVSMAGGLPLLLALRSRPAKLTAAGVALAILASASKTAWLMAAWGASLHWPRARPLGLRWRLVLPAAAIGVALAYYAPVLVGSRAMLDAARSRHSLNRRAELMVRMHPLFGSGAGMNTVIEQATFPHYRVNGVDAHGVIQKVGGELGLLGLLGYGWFTLATAAALRRRWEEDGAQHSGAVYGAAAMWGVSTAGLLLSTETFSQTWWAPMAVSWGLAHNQTCSETNSDVDES